MKRVALYVRVSTQEQKKHGLSVDSQILALKEYAKEKKYSVVGIYNDAGFSARKSYKTRPAMQELISDCKDGKVDLILFTKLDRWFRSVGDYYAVQQQLDEYKVPWRAIWEDYETETSSGVFKVNIMLSVAQSEADRTSERIRSTFDYKRAKGDYIGQVPYGYKRVDGKLYKDENTQEIVEKMFEHWFKTRSTTEVCKMLTREGHHFSRHRVQRVLWGEAYTGTAQGHPCEAYITPEQGELIQKVRKEHIRGTKRVNQYLFAGMCKCSVCGHKMHSGCNHTDGKRYYLYYCTGQDSTFPHERYVSTSEKKLEKRLLAILEEEISQYNAQVDLERDSSEEEDTKKQIDALNKKLKRIGIRFEDGDISEEEYKEKRSTTIAEIQSLQMIVPKRKEKIILPYNWSEVYASLDFEHKRQFWLSIIDYVEITDSNSMPRIFFL